MVKIYLTEGGVGSGNFGHSGRPGLVGGSGQDITSETFAVDPATEEYVNRPYADVGISTKHWMPNSSGSLWRISKELQKQLGWSDNEGIQSVMLATGFRPMLTSYAGSAIYEAVSRVFGVPLSDYQKNRIAELPRQGRKWGVTKRDIQLDYKANGWSAYDRYLDEPHMDALVKQVYANTQNYFKEKGIKEITLYRGLGEGKHYNSALSSWTIDPDVAKGFGKVVSKTVPVEKVFSTPRFGFGVNSQLEVLVIGDSNETD